MRCPCAELKSPPSLTHFWGVPSYSHLPVPVDQVSDLPASMDMLRTHQLSCP